MASSVSDAPSWVAKWNLRWLHRLLVSSIGQKFIMGITGLLLCGFLVGHLTGNLLLYVGAKEFNEYADFLHHQKFLPLIELGLLCLFLAHLYLAVITTRQNRAARAQNYYRRESKQGTGLIPAAPHSWMFISGSVVLGFVLLHLADLRFALRPDFDYDGLATPYATTVAALSNPFSRMIYFIGTIFLGFHLSHGFGSAFQSLGLSAPKYKSLIQAASIAFAVLIAGGFASLVIFVPGIAKQPTPAASAGAETAPAK
jgi:succinate dehydrogenase / fumarate reductase, cytochrome b subunit